MKYSPRPLLVSLILLVVAQTAHAATGSAFLKIGAGADVMGMGEAVVSNVNGPSSVYWNPGALALMKGLQAGFVHNESIMSVRQEYVALTKSFGRLGLGTAFNGTWTDNLDSYDESANYLGTFGYYGLTLGVAGAYSVTPTWGIGAGIKMVREVIDVYDATGVAFDLGIQGREVLPRLDVGLSLLHAGSALSYVDESFELPMTVQGGASYRLPLPTLGSQAVVAAEVRKVKDEDASFRGGVEYHVQQVARLRVGYRSGLDTEDVSFGIGLRRGALQGDYAYVPFGEDLGPQHRFGITYRMEPEPAR